MNKPGLFTDKPIVVFDLETTGVDTEVDRIIQFAAVKLDTDFVVAGRFFRTIDPEIPIDAGATAVHGISNDDINGAPKFAEVACDINMFMHDCDLAGHNGISFDIPLLINEFDRVGIEFKLDGRRLIDTLELDRHYRPHTLEGALRHYCDEELTGAHDALCDTEATAKVLKAQLAAHSINVDAAAQLSWGRRVTLDGKLARDKEGNIIINFGKHKGKRLDFFANHDIGFLNWILKKDFSEELKSIVRKAIRGELDGEAA